MVDVGFEVSIPSKLTVPVGKTCKLFWLGAVMFTRDLHNRDRVGRFGPAQAGNAANHQVGVNQSRNYP
jgi:hypothetical protein